MDYINTHPKYNDHYVGFGTNDYLHSNGTYGRPPNNGAPTYRQNTIRNSRIVREPNYFKWSWLATLMNISALILCLPWSCCCFTVGIMFTTWAYSDHQIQNERKYKMNNRLAIGCGCFAIFYGLLIWIILIVLVVVYGVSLYNFFNLISNTDGNTAA